MAKKSNAAKLQDTRINRAVVGFQIPMMLIPQIYNALRAAIAAGNPDDRLKEIVAAFPGVVATQ